MNFHNLVARNVTLTPRLINTISGDVRHVHMQYCILTDTLLRISNSSDLSHFHFTTTTPEKLLHFSFLSGCNTDQGVAMIKFGFCPFHFTSLHFTGQYSEGMRIVTSESAWRDSCNNECRFSITPLYAISFRPSE